MRLGHPLAILPTEQMRSSVGNIKWRNSWNYYRDEALPLAKEQQGGSVLAFKEGAIDYVTFLQNIRDAIRIEVNAWSAFNDYLDSRYQLEYYLKNSN